MEKVVKYSDIPIGKDNPFMPKLKNTMLVKTRQGIVKSAPLYTADGEQRLTRMFADVKDVDSSAFTKVFQDKVSEWAGLNATGNKVFGYILANLEPNQAEVYIYVQDVMEFCGWSERNMVYRGLVDLYNHNLIYRSPKRHIWYINPDYLFNGDRVSFVRTYKVTSKTIDIDSEVINSFVDLKPITELPATEESTPEQIEAYKRSGEDETSSTLPVNTKVHYHAVGDYVRPDQGR